MTLPKYSVDSCRARTNAPAVAAMAVPIAVAVARHCRVMTK
jgi:hypothetical protein